MLGTFLYPFSAYAAVSQVKLTLTMSHAIGHAVGIINVSQGVVAYCDVIPINTNLDSPLNAGDLITVGTYQTPTGHLSDCSKKGNRLSVIFHGRIKSDKTIPIN